MEFYVRFGLGVTHSQLRSLPRVLVRARAIPGFVDDIDCHWVRCRLTRENCRAVLDLAEALRDWGSLECWLDGRLLRDVDEAARVIRDAFDP